MDPLPDDDCDVGMIIWSPVSTNWQNAPESPVFLFFKLRRTQSYRQRVYKTPLFKNSCVNFAVVLFR